VARPSPPSPTSCSCGAAAPTARVIDFYLRESFGGQALEDEDLEALKEALIEAEKSMRKAG